MHAISKIIRGVDMKIAIEDSKTCNIAAMRKRLKKRGADETKSF